MRHIRGSLAVASRRDIGRRSKERGAVYRGRGLELALESFEQFREIRSAGVQPADLAGRDARERKLLERTGERARKARHRRHRGEVRQRVIAIGVEQHTRGDGLHAQRGRWRQTLAGQPRRREACGELGETEAVEAERRAPRPRDVAGEVVGRAAGCRDDQHFSCGRRFETETGERFRGGPPRTWR